MNSTTLMDRLFCDGNLKIEKLDKGLTNHNYLLHLDGASYVLRTPHFDSEHIVNRHHETLALDAIRDSGIDVETIYYDETSGYKVTTYISQALDFSQYLGDDNILRVAQLMKRFHNLHKHIGVSFDPINRYQQYRSHVTLPLYDISAYETIMEEVASLQFESVLCHNDWVEGNILFCHNDTYLIDYEYAADNDPLFDVMSFLSENNIVDPTLRKQFYDTYFDHMDDEIWHRLHVWECFHNLLWCMWAMMMWEQRHEEIYKSIAKDKYQALQTTANRS